MKDLQVFCHLKCGGSLLQNISKQEILLAITNFCKTLSLRVTKPQMAVMEPLHQKILQPTFKTPAKLQSSLTKMAHLYTCRVDSPPSCITPLGVGRASEFSKPAGIPRHKLILVRFLLPGSVYIG